jgi:copper chaperone CopZ
MSRNHRFVAAGAVLLAFAGLVVLGCSRTDDGDSPRGDKAAEKTEHRQVFTVEGMTCEGCVGTVTAALEGLPGVESVQVSLANKQAVVVGHRGNATEQAVITAIEEAGYQACPAQMDTRSSR